METTLWILQVLLAAIFFITGSIKLTQSRAKLAAGPMRWAADVSDRQFRLIGALEVLAAVGLIVPAALGVAPALTALAAAGLVLIMVGAFLTHLRYGETNRVAVPVLVLALALVVMVGRLDPYSL